MDNKSYIKGFNTGYFLRKNDPNLLNIVIKSAPKELSFTRGLLDGADRQERSKDVRVARTPNDPDRSRDNGRGDRD